MLCLCGCGDKGKTRGLCPKAYHRYYQEVANRETTWSKLVAEGKALKAKKRIRYTAQNWGWTGKN